MESFYYYIAIAGIASFLTNESADKFRGSSAYAKLWLSIVALIGMFSFIATIITLFFYITWWHPIVIFVVTMGLSWLFGSFGRNGFVGLGLSFVIVIFNILAWTNFLNFI